MTNIAIVILNWQQPQLTIDTIKSLSKIKFKNFNYQIFLLDNNSQDDSFTIFKKEFLNISHIKLIQTGNNLGYVGNNVGIKKAIKEWSGT